MISFRASSKEEECLLKEGEACSSRSQSSNNTDLSNRTDDCSSYESAGPLQSTVALHNPHSALSEPMTLQSHTESASFQTSIPTQPPSQPTSPNIISPITTSPHVNVNITFNIGNGSDRTQCVTPTSLVQTDCQLPFGEKEETFNIPLQEAGKQAAVAVQESTGFSVWRVTCMKKTDDNVWPRFVISTQNSLITEDTLGLLISPERPNISAGWTWNSVSI